MSHVCLSHGGSRDFQRLEKSRRKFHAATGLQHEISSQCSLSWIQSPRHCPTSPPVCRPTRSDCQHLYLCWTATADSILQKNYIDFANVSAGQDTRSSDFELQVLMRCLKREQSPAPISARLKATLPLARRLIPILAERLFVIGNDLDERDHVDARTGRKVGGQDGTCIRGHQGTN